MAHVKVFSANCPLCTEVIQQIQSMICSSCTLEVLDMHNPESYQQAQQLEIKRVPAVVINGKVAECCQIPGVDFAYLRQNGGCTRT